MYKGSSLPGSEKDGNETSGGVKKRGPRPHTLPKRAQSASPMGPNTQQGKSASKAPGNRRCQSVSPSFAKKSLECFNFPPPQESTSAPESMDNDINDAFPASLSDQDKDLALPQCMVVKMTRTLVTKKREFIKSRKSLITLQNSVLEQYAMLKDMETRAGMTTDESLGEVRILSVTSWPAHDLLLLVRNDLQMPFTSELSGVFGPQVLQQIHAQLSPIPEELLTLGADLMARRIDLLNLMRNRHRADRSTYLCNLEWKAKNNEFDQETEKIHRMVAGIAENLKAKINYSLELAKIPWLDRESIVKKMERYQKESMILQHKVDELLKKDCPDCKDSIPPSDNSASSYQAVLEELSKERAAREALKDVVSAAEGMLRVARTRIATLERQLKDNKADLEAARRKQKDLEQLYRHRESNYDARSKKLIEVSKTGEMTIEALSRQRDALELRVKELREMAANSEKIAASRENEQQARVEALQSKVAEEEKKREAANNRVVELELRVKELEANLRCLRERSGKLVDMERRRCLEYVPTKENEPSDRETEIWKELQVTRLALSRAEEELKQSRADKDSFLDSLAKIAVKSNLKGFNFVKMLSESEINEVNARGSQQDGAENGQDRIATELLEREKKIAKLQHIIEEQRENEKLMENSMTQYENQLAALRLEVKRLRSYDCYVKDIPYSEIQTELLELHMQVEALSRERSALVTAAASRALMLERYERAADLFARVTRARRDLSAVIDDRTDPPQLTDTSELSRSLSLVCANSADTWSALRAERARVLRLEGAVLAQSLQLEREGRVRTQLERRRAILEREVLRGNVSSVTSANNNVSIIKNPLIQDIFCYR